MAQLSIVSPPPPSSPAVPALTRSAAASITAELLAVVARGAVREGTNETALPGLRYHRESRPSPAQRWCSFGLGFTVVAQGRKVSTYRGLDLPYDPLHYLVVTGEAQFEGKVIEATPERPFLAFCYEIPPDVVASTILALADADRAGQEPAVDPDPTPAFVGSLDAPMADCFIRLLRAVDDPLERRLVAPLVVQELVFRLLRSDAAAAMRSAVGRDRDAEKIQSAMSFLHASIDRPVTVEDVARHVAMSPSHFAHRFRAVARVSPMRYLKQLRLNHARSLLIADGLRVSEASARAGYESTSHFTRDFRAFFGAAPGEYARRFREG